MQFHREELEKRGVEWPTGLTPEAMHKRRLRLAHLSQFHHPALHRRLAVLPHAAAPGESGSVHLGHLGVRPLRARRRSRSPNTRRVTDYKDFFDVNRFLKDDLINLPEVQHGMYSRGFRGLRTNPVQEVCMSNLHKVLHDFIDGDR